MLVDILRTFNLIVEGLKYVYIVVIVYDNCLYSHITARNNVIRPGI